MYSSYFRASVHQFHWRHYESPESKNSTFLTSPTYKGVFEASGRQTLYLVVMPGIFDPHFSESIASTNFAVNFGPVLETSFTFSSS